MAFEPPKKAVKEKFILSAIIGMWRMGADDASISCAVGVDLKLVFNTIRTYQMSLK